MKNEQNLRNLQNQPVTVSQKTGLKAYCTGGVRGLRFCGFRPFFHAVLRFSTNFLCGFRFWAALSCGFAVSIVACSLRFFSKIWCGFSVLGCFEPRFCGFYHFE